MSQYTNLYTKISFSGATFNSKREVEEELENVRFSIQRAKEDLSKLAYMTEPEKWCGEDSPDYWVKYRLQEALEELEDSTIAEFKLQLLLDNWDKCHTENGLGIDLPDELYGKSFINGDFVLTDKHPTQASLL